MRAKSTLPRLTLVSRETIEEQVYREIRDALMRGRFVPGATVTLRALADAFGTSPMPIRAAIRQLVAEQALVARPNRTVIVPLITPERFDEIRHIRVALEGMLAAKAAERIDDSEIRRVAKIYDDINAAVAEDSIRGYLVGNQEFHFAIYRAANLPSALRMVENLWLQVGPLLNFLLRAGNEPSSAYFNHSGRAFQKYHRSTLEALRRRDATAARQGIADDINVAADFLLKTAHFVRPLDPQGTTAAHIR